MDDTATTNGVSKDRGVTLETLDLKSLIDAKAWVLIDSTLHGCMQFYRHVQTKLPLLIFKGGSRHDASFVGIILLFRSGEGMTANLKVECSLDQAPSMLQHIDDAYRKAEKLEGDNVYRMWVRFTQTVMQEMMPRLFSQQEQEEEEREQCKPEAGNG